MRADPIRQTLVATRSVIVGWPSPRSRTGCPVRGNACVLASPLSPSSNDRLRRNLIPGAHIGSGAASTYSRPRSGEFNNTGHSGARTPGSGLWPARGQAPPASPEPLFWPEAGSMNTRYEHTGRAGVDGFRARPRGPSRNDDVIFPVICLTSASAGTSGPEWILPSVGYRCTR